jgi:hypothetical protein
MPSTTTAFRLPGTAGQASEPQDHARAEPARTPKNRVQLDLTPRSMNILAELKEKTEAASYAEVIRNALKLYDGLIAEAEKGNGFLVQDAAGNIAPFKMFL